MLVSRWLTVTVGWLRFHRQASEWNGHPEPFVYGLVFGQSCMRMVSLFGSASLRLLELNGHWRRLDAYKFLSSSYIVDSSALQ
jgi:hypothetical protein